jgi:NADH dehydrogenase
MVASNSQIKRIVTFSLKEIFEGFAVEILQSKVTKIDIAEGDIHFESGTAIKYDWLLMAAGSQVNYFNIPGLAQYSLSIKSFADALRIRERIIEHVENEERPRIQVLIGGGGPTGVELAGEIKNLLHELPRITVGKCLDGVTIIDGGATILSVFSQGIIARAQKRLAALEIQTMPGERIQSVDEKAVSLASGKKVPYDILIWTGGVMPNQLMSTMKMKTRSLCLPRTERHPSLIVECVRERETIRGLMKTRSRCLLGSWSSFLPIA